jgi:hypothetical protein
MAVWRSDPDLATRFHPRFPDHLQVVLHDGEPRRSSRSPEACWVEVTALHGRVRFPGVAGDIGASRETERVHWVERPVYRATLLHATKALTICEGQSLLFVVVPGVPYPLQIDESYLAERVRWAFRPCDRCGADQGLDPPSTMARTRFASKPGWEPIRFTAFCSCGGTMELQRLDTIGPADASIPSPAPAPRAVRPTPPPPPPRALRPTPPPPRAVRPTPPPPPRALRPTPSPPRAEPPSVGPVKPRTRWVWIPDPEGRALAFTYVDRMAGPSAKGAKIGDAPGEAEIRRAVDHPDVTYRDPERFGAVPVSPEEALRLGLPKDPPWIGHFEPKPIPPPRGEPSRVVTGRVLRGGAPVRSARVKMGPVSGHARELIALDQRATDGDGCFAFPLAPMSEVFVIADIPGMSSRLVPVPDEGPVDIELEPFGGMAGRIARAGAPVAAQVSLIGLDGGPHRVARSRGDGRYQVDDLVPGRYEVTVEALNRDGMTNGTRVLQQIGIAGGRTAARDFALAAGAVVHVSVALPAGADSAHVFLVTGRIAVQRQSQLRPLFHTPALRSANQLSTKDGQLTTEFRDVMPGEYTVCAAPWDRSGGGDRDPPLASRVIAVAAAPLTVELALP